MISPHWLILFIGGCLQQKPCNGLLQLGGHFVCHLFNQIPKKMPGSVAVEVGLVWKEWLHANNSVNTTLRFSYYFQQKPAAG